MGQKNTGTSFRCKWILCMTNPSLNLYIATANAGSSDLKWQLTQETYELLARQCRWMGWVIIKSNSNRSGLNDLQAYCQSVIQCAKHQISGMRIGIWLVAQNKWSNGCLPRQWKTLNMSGSCQVHCHLPFITAPLYQIDFWRSPGWTLLQSTSTRLTRTIYYQPAIIGKLVHGIWIESVPLPTPQFHLPFSTHTKCHYVTCSEPHEYWMSCCQCWKSTWYSSPWHYMKQQTFPHTMNWLLL